MAALHGGAEQGELFASQWLQGDYQPRVHAYYFKQWRQFEMPYHRHDSTEIMYVISGACRVEMEPGPEASKRAEAFAMKRGDFVILNANAGHRLVVEGSCRMLNVEFGLSQWTGSVPSLRSLAEEDAMLLGLLRFRSTYAALRDPEEVYHTLKSLVLELDGAGLSGGAMTQLLLAQLLIKIARLWRDAQGSGVPDVEKYVKASLEYLHQNYDRDIQAKDVAAFVNLHPGYLQRIFKLQTGQTLAAYLTALRMEKSKMLLQRTDIPVSDISEYVGVGSRQYFHALFRKHAGCTPVEYRRRLDRHIWSEE